MSTTPWYVEIAPVTNVVFASCNVLIPAAAVGALGVPAREASYAFALSPNEMSTTPWQFVTAVATYAVVAIWVELSLAAAVGARGVPAREASKAFAFEFKAV